MGEVEVRGCSIVKVKEGGSNTSCYRNSSGEAKQLQRKDGSTNECRDTTELLFAWNSKNHEKSVRLQMKEKNIVIVMISWVILVRPFSFAKLLGHPRELLLWLKLGGHLRGSFLG